MTKPWHFYTVFNPLLGKHSDYPTQAHEFYQKLKAEGLADIIPTIEFCRNHKHTKVFDEETEEEEKILEKELIYETFYKSLYS